MPGSKLYQESRASKVNDTGEHCPQCLTGKVMQFEWRG